MIVCSVATVPGREVYLARTLRTLRPQVDLLVLHVWDDVLPKLDMDLFMSFAALPDMIRCSSEISGRTSTEAKFWIAHKDHWPHGGRGNDDVHLACDDDLLYPPDYAARMVEELDRHHPGAGAVGVHAAALVEGPITTYRRSIRHVASTEDPLDACRRVDVLGAGTVAYRPARWQFDDEDFVEDNAGDAGFALAAARRRLSLVAVQRPARWLVDQRAPDPLWDRADRHTHDGAPARVLRRIPRRRV